MTMTTMISDCVNNDINDNNNNNNNKINRIFLQPIHLTNSVAE